MKRRTSFNPKRRFKVSPPAREQLDRLVDMIGYGGNPEHKRNPGDFGLNPPTQPRADKTLCDLACVFTRQQALNLLKEGVRRGLISAQTRGEFPQNIWAVTQGQVPVEAQLENAGSGVYHAYPMPSTDPFVEEVMKRWNS